MASKLEKNKQTCIYRVYILMAFRTPDSVASNTWLKHYFFIILPFLTAAAAAAKSLQSWQTLCDPIDGSPPGSAIPGILQVRTLEWVAISFSNAGKWKVKVKSLSGVRLFVTPWTAAHQAPPSMGLSRQEYWSGLPLPSPFSLLELSISLCIAFPSGFQWTSVTLVHKPVSTRSVTVSPVPDTVSAM